MNHDLDHVIEYLSIRILEHSNPQESGDNLDQISSSLSFVPQGHDLSNRISTTHPQNNVPSQNTNSYIVRLITFGSLLKYILQGIRGCDACFGHYYGQCQ